MSTTTANTAQTALTRLPAANTRQMPWDVMGGALAAEFTSVQDALDDRHLDFQARMVPLQAVETPSETAPGLTLPAPMGKAVVRPMPDGTEQVVGVTGNRYTPIQNRDAFSVADLLVAEYGAKITGAADYHGGNASLLVVTMPNPIQVDTPRGREDRVNMNLIMKNAHDGSAALTFALTGVRIACTNAVQAAIRGAARTWKVNHTPNAGNRMDLAHAAIIQAMNYQDAFQEQAQAMMDRTMMDAEFNKIVAQLWPVEDEDTRAGQNRLALREEVQNVYYTSDTLTDVRGTLWGGLNALTEWVDWGRPVRLGETQRAQGTLEGAPVKMKERVWDLFAAAAN